MDIPVGSKFDVMFPKAYTLAKNQILIREQVRQACQRQAASSRPPKSFCGTLVLLPIREVYRARHQTCPGTWLAFLWNKTATEPKEMTRAKSKPCPLVPSSSLFCPKPTVDIPKGKRGCRLHVWVLVEQQLPWPVFPPKNRIQQPTESPPPPPRLCAIDLSAARTTCLGWRSSSSATCGALICKPWGP